MGLSLRKLEAAIDGLVSAQSIGKYERGEMTPSSPVLQALAKALKVQPDYLTTTREIKLTGIDFRQAPHQGANEERALKAAILDRVERYLHLEELFPDLRDAWDAPDASEFGIRRVEDAEQAAEKLRELWQLGVEPIPQMAELLEEKGIKVIALELAGKVSGSSGMVNRPDQPGIPVVVVNDRHDATRQRFTLARELAHLLLKCVGLSDREEEQAADRFAHAFLMAKDMMRQFLGGTRTQISVGELVQLQRLFKVNTAHLVERCSQLNILSKGACNELKDKVRALGLHSPNILAPNALPPERPQRMERLCLRAVAESALSEARGADLLHMSVRGLRRRMVGGHRPSPVPLEAVPQ